MNRHSQYRTKGRQVHTTTNAVSVHPTAGITAVIKLKLQQSLNPGKSEKFLVQNENHENKNKKILKIDLHDRYLHRKCFMMLKIEWVIINICGIASSSSWKISL